MRPRLFALLPAAAAIASGGCTSFHTLAESPDAGRAIPATDAASDAAGDAAGDGSCGEGATKGPGGCGAKACDAGVCPPVVLVDGVNFLADLTVLGEHVYWASSGTEENDLHDGAIARASITPCGTPGGCPETVVSAPSTLSLAADASDIFFTIGQSGEGSEVLDLPAGQTASTSFASLTAPLSIALDASSVYVVLQGTGNGDGAIFRKYRDPVDGDTGASIVTGLDSPYQVSVATVAGSEQLFFTTRGALGLDDDGDLWVSDVDGQNATKLATGQVDLRGFAVGATFVYWVNMGDGTIHRARHDGTEAAQVVSEARSPTHIVTDDTRIYWTEAGTAPDYVDGRVRMANSDGSNVVVLADGYHYPGPIAMDATNLYVGVRGSNGANYSDGKVLEVRKP